MKAGPLGIPTLVALVVANMIGAGVFTTSGFALGDLGSRWLVLAAWVVGGLVALTGALSYGALVRLMPQSGGEYLFLSRAVHPLAGFLAGWISLLAGFTGAIAFAAITFVAYATSWPLDSPPGRILASIVILVAAVLHGISLRPGTAVQNFAVAVKLGAIALFVLFAFTAGEPASWAGWTPRTGESSGAFPLATFALSLMWISFSYSGFNAAIYIAGEVPSGAKIVPRALVIGTALTTLVYLMLNAVFVLAADFEAIAFREDVAAVAALTIGGPPLELAVRALIALALFTSVSAMIMVGPRVYAKMADDGLLPAMLRFEGAVPVAAIWMQAALAIIVVWISGLRELLSYLGFTLGLSTAATVASVFLVARRGAAGGARLPALPGYPWAPALFVASTLIFAALAATVSPVEMIAAVVTVLAGAMLYFFMSKEPGDVDTERHRQNAERGERNHVAER